jgi:predicted aspartyl protease
MHANTVLIGSFDNLGCPTIEIEVSGPVHPSKKFTAMVDTGFSGFLLLPILEAFPVGLILRGTMPIILADGSQQTKLTCLGELHFDGKSEVGLIIIEWENTQILVGMEFLRKFRKRLIVDPVDNKIEIVDGPSQLPPAFI